VSFIYEAEFTFPAEPRLLQNEKNACSRSAANPEKYIFNRLSSLCYTVHLIEKFEYAGRQGRRLFLKCGSSKL